MSKPIHNPSRLSPITGFTLVELMLAMALSLLLLGLVLTLVQKLNYTTDIVASTSDVNENLRAAMNMVSRDLSTAGQNIPVGGIPVPNGTGASAINRPGPAGTSAFPAGTTNIPVLTPGNGLGRAQGSGTNVINTDIVTVIGVNQFSPFNQTPVTGSPTVSATQAQITVSTAAAGYVALGQLIMLTNTNGSCLLAATSVNTTTGVITFKNGDPNDPLGVNQFSASLSGTINQLETSSTQTWPAIAAYPISMVTYYLDTSNPGRLMKQIVMGTPQPVALGINVMRIFYSLSPPATLNGVQSDPTENPWPTTSDPNNSPNNIRKVVLTMIGEADHQNLGNSQWYSRSITNAVTIQNLDYYNKYSLGASMTQN
jgi:type II secretory pathway pseudopilin PulG